MSTVRVYRSTDPGAPAHPSDTRGSQAAQLRACLVTGYGNISITSLVVIGEVATATVDGGNTLGIGTVVELSGATANALNTEWRINASAAATFSFPAPGIADCTDTGTITATIPGAGWEEPFAESGNIACFRALEGARQFYQIDDNQTSLYVSKIRAGESMPDVATVNGQWAESYFGKIYQYNTLPTNWVVIADERTCYLWFWNYKGMHLHGFGELKSVRTDDPYNSFCGGHMNATYPGVVSVPTTGLMRPMPLGTASSLGLFVHKSLFGTHGAQAAPSLVASGVSASMGSLDLFGAESSVAGMNYILTPVMIHCLASAEDVKNLIRGVLRGVFEPLAARPETDRAIINYNSRKFLTIDHNTSNTEDSSSAGQLMIDITGDWD